MALPISWGERGLLFTTKGTEKHEEIIINSEMSWATEHTEYTEKYSIYALGIVNLWLSYSKPVLN